MKEIDNFDLINDILTFNSPDEFYHLMILKRKKDQPEETKKEHQSVRTIKTYSITSKEYLNSKKSEIIELCKLFNTRAYIYINKVSFKQTSYQLLKEISDRLINNQYNTTHIFDSAVGNVPTLEKRWIVDIDIDDSIQDVDLFKNELINYINNLEPNNDTNKIISIIPTKNGFHLITEKFNSQLFKLKYRNIGIHKKNPTILYIS